MDPGTARSSPPPGSARGAHTGAAVAGITKVSVVANPPPVSAPRRVGFESGGKHGDGEPGDSDGSHTGGADGEGGDIAHDLSVDDVNAILGVHGYASIDEAVVIDLHETGVRSTKPLAVFANAQIMFLHSNAISDLTDLWKLTCLVKLDLAHNMIEELPSPEHMGCLVNLKLLYLHNNAIEDWAHVGSLASVPQLTMLTMHHNPLSEHPKFRHYVVNKVPQLQALDAHLVADEERIGHEEGDTPQPHPAPFTALSEPLEVPPPQYHPTASPELHLKAMTIELRHLIKLKKKRSPVVMVQRVMRASVDRRWVRRRRKMGMWAAVRIQSAARYARWRKSMLHSIDKFLLEVEPRLVISYQDNEHTRAAWIIQLWWKKVKPDPRLYRAAVLIATLLRRRVAGVHAARTWLREHGCLSIVFDQKHRQRVLAAAAVAWRATHNEIRKVPEWWLARKQDVEAGVAGIKRDERRERTASRLRKTSRSSNGGRSPWAKSPTALVSHRGSPRSLRSPTAGRPTPRSGRQTPKGRGSRLGGSTALAKAGVVLGMNLPALSAWNLRYPGDYCCPAVDGAAEEAMEGDIRFAMYFVENRVRRTALQCIVQPQDNAPDRVVFRRRPDAARYLAAHGERQLATSAPLKPYRPVSESLRQANYRRYRILKRRVTRTPKADINAFKATVARVDMDVGRMVGSRRAAPPANTRHFTTGLSPEDVAAMEAAAAAAAAAARGESDCDSDDGLDPYTAALRAEQKEGQEEARRRVAREAKEKRESSRTLMVVTLPTVELCLRTLVALRAMQFREEGPGRSRLLLPGYFATVLDGGVVGVGQHATRDAAATAIQSTWRSYHTRQVLEPPLHLRLARQRGAVLMQRVFRMRHLRWRMQLLSALAHLSYGIDSEYMYLEESVYRVLLDSSLWGRDRQEGGQSRDTTGHANPGGSRRPSQQLEEELWEAVGATEAVAVTKARPRHPVEQWVATGGGGKGKRGGGGGKAHSPKSKADASVMTHPSVPSIDADSKPVRPKSGGRLMGFRASGTTNVLTKGTTPRPPVARDPAKDGRATVTTTIPGRPAPGLPPRPWRHPYIPEHELEVCVISGRLRLVQPRRPSERWLGRRVGLPLWLGWGVDWVKAPATRPNRPYSAVVQGLHTKTFRFDNVALLTEGVDIAPVTGKLSNPAFREYDSQLVSRGATTRHGRTHASFELDPPDWTSRGVRLLELRFQSVQEARVRACVLLARTWHPFSRCGATMYSHSQVDAAWRRGKAGMPGKAVAAYPMPAVPDVDVPALPTRWALRFAWSDWEVIKLPKHLQVPLSSRRPASPNGPASSPSPVDSGMAGSTPAQLSYPVTPMPDESQTTPRLPPPAQLYGGGAVPQAAVRGGLGPQGSVHVPHMAPVKPGHASARGRGPSPITDNSGAMYPTQPSSKPPPRAGQSLTRRRSLTQHVEVSGGVPPVTMVREGDPSLRRAIATAPSPLRDTQLPRSQSFNTHRTRKGMGPDGAVSQQAWRPFQTGRHMQSAMGAAANAHVHELRKMTKLQLRRKRREEVEANRRRVQSARAESRNRRHAADIDRTLQRRRDEQQRLKGKLDVAHQLEAADGEQEDEREVRAAIVRERRMRQQKKREDRVFSSGFAASQNLVTRHLAAGMRRRKAKEDRGQVLAKRREFDRVRAARQRYRELSQQVTDEEKKRNVQKMKMTAEQGLQQRRQQELVQQQLARENVLQSRQMMQLHRAFRDTANASGMRAAMRQGAAGPLELAVLSARHNYMVAEGRPLSAQHAPARPVSRGSSEAPNAGLERVASFTGSVSDMGELVQDVGDDYELVDGVDPFGAMALGSPTAVHGDYGGGGGEAGHFVGGGDGGGGGGEWHGGVGEHPVRLHRTNSGASGMSRSTHNRSARSLRSEHTAASGSSFRQQPRASHRVDVPVLTLAAPPVSPGRAAGLDSTTVAPRTATSQSTAASPGGFVDSGHGRAKAWGTPTRSRRSPGGRRGSADGAGTHSALHSGRSSGGGGTGPSGLKASSLVRQRRVQSATRARHGHATGTAASSRTGHGRPPPSPQPSARQTRHQWQPPQGGLRGASVDADDMPSLVAGVGLAGSRRQ